MMTSVEALDRLHKALALNPYEGMRRAQELVRVFPHLSPDVRHHHADDAWAVLRDWTTWGGNFDVDDYIEALRVLLPSVSEGQVLKLWERAVSEWHSDDSERRWFAEFSLVLIAEHLSELLLKIRWRDVASERFSGSRSRINFLVAVGNRLPELRLRLHYEAWQVATEGDRPDSEWLSTLVTKLAPEVCWEQWSALISQLQNKDLESSYGPCSLVTVLVDGVPEIGIQQACLDLCSLDSFHAYQWCTRFASATSRLIQRAPFETEKKRLLAVVVDHLIELGTRPRHICDPYVFAGELLCRVPEEIRGSQWSRVVAALRAVSSAVRA